MRIAFFVPQIDERGTTIASFDYAFYNREKLGNESVVIYNSQDVRNVPDAITRFRAHFDLFEISCGEILHNMDGHQVMQQVDPILKNVGADAMYILKGGQKDGLVSTKTPTLVHCTAYKNEPHGAVYAYVSEHVSLVSSNNAHPVVPHMIDLPHHNDNFRKSLGIKEDHTVFGRTGGIDTWNLPFVNDIIAYALEQRQDIEFIFQNTPQFISHPRVHFIERSVDLNTKVSFINTCDFLLHARQEGESFGLVCGEFSIKNKPVITWFDSPQRNHIDVLGDKGIYYSTPQDLYLILARARRTNTLKDEFNCYQDYNPDQVMEKFDRVFCSRIKEVL